MKETELEIMKKKCLEMKMHIPDDGYEAKTAMKVYLNFKCIKKYSIARDFAIYYKEDVSSLPEKLTEEMDVSLIWVDGVWGLGQNGRN